MRGLGIVDWDTPGVGWGVIVSIEAGEEKDVIKLVGSSATEAWCYDEILDDIVSKPCDYASYPTSVIIAHFVLQESLRAEAHTIVAVAPTKEEIEYKLSS